MPLIAVKALSELLHLVCRLIRENIILRIDLLKRFHTQIKEQSTDLNCQSMLNIAISLLGVSRLDHWLRSTSSIGIKPRSLQHGVMSEPVFGYQ